MSAFVVGLSLPRGCALSRGRAVCGALSTTRRAARSRRARGRHVASASASAGGGGSGDVVLRKLRAELAARGVDAFVVPSGDPHFSEYAAAAFARRAYVSGFGGSAGTAVVTAAEALLWTDGRYFLQAEKELGEGWTLMRAGLPGTVSVTRWLADSLPEGAKVGVDAMMHSVAGGRALEKALKEQGKALVQVDGNPVDAVWEERPALGCAPVRVHPEVYAGVGAAEKVRNLREAMSARKADAMLVTALDEVCWLLNVRGGDVPHCPVVIAYAVVGLDDVVLYVDEEKVALGGDVLREALQTAGVEVRPYDAVAGDVRARAERSERVWVDPATTSLALAEAAGEDAVVASTPIALAKALKNPAEMDAMREAHLRDGAALVKFLCWLEEQVADGGSVSEVAAAVKLRGFRAQVDGFVDTSFDTIAGAGANGAVIHYSPVEGECRDVTNREVFLLDSGGQYVDGTTDVTRTMHFGRASAHERECFTRVLQGHIAVDAAVFPAGTTGLLLDAFARAPLWGMGLEYRHGTGHGVGACLNVHEGPHSISPRVASNAVALQRGMVVSNEPGYYEDGKFGIRIENLVFVVEKDTKHRYDDGVFLGFERLTHVPIDMGMIVPELLNADEVAWLEEYHRDVWQRIAPLLAEDSKEREWLRKMTRPLAAVHASAAPATV